MPEQSTLRDCEIELLKNLLNKHQNEKVFNFRNTCCDGIRGL
ncbi:hypothetical protein BN938_2154 [Mucinivorans hirudinis]|uniref:Uncharacterized protein n=1 Tax=Mucinivorans hirudinis TaxID=1433126 RepID=A0A060R9G7_9BACT|nr:hypothetical protein BN938_2154 [Mucinivorans hirudinis]